MKTNKAYLVLIAFQLTCIGIKYGVSNTNPFQQSALLLFLTSLFSHVLASTGDMTKLFTIITLHLSGIVACETLLWILIAQLLWCSIINFLLLLLARFLFFNFITQILVCFFNRINQLLHGTSLIVVQMPNMELQPHEAQVLKKPSF